MFVYTSFTKIFCQNTVKKNCKPGVLVFVKKADVSSGKRYGKHAPRLR